MTAKKSLQVYRQSTSGGAEADLERALTLLHRTRDANRTRDAAGLTDVDVFPLLRLYRPEPTVAFGQRDERLPGFAAAAQACREEGFTPLVRRAGGRAAAYHRGSLVIDHIEPDPDPIRHSQARFTEFGELLREALEAAGVSARLGPIPGEYCPGDHSVHGVSRELPDVRIKLIGTAQRVIGSGWLFSSSIIVQDGAPIRRVLSRAYAALGIPWDPLTAGAITQLGVDITVEKIEAAVLQAYSRRWTLEGIDEPSPIPSNIASTD
ncbi:lipoate--protein ligase family protein [Nesterenkonia sp. E16_7]|uniref:lipoate--protein ligase family protein n=1 Tax=unclassified Nesterenkonia TaxID=2629769 RepID=UPI001A92DE2B|nr:MULTISPECIES: lipoate--protein ligase family protein [unclassified Nesterenkonia]MBO0595905.1 lipoate--protein ligase family protein [Nesterenkonia sp. E16_10]MBO0599496.1 lipoate--protein ligase family protein [Nesterenkonia sp. E16_7]